MKTKQFIKDQKGAAIVEFAIVLPLLVLLVFGIIEFGILLYNQSVITNASREGARAGITGLDESAIAAIAVNYCQDRLITFTDTQSDPVPTVVRDGGSPQETLTVSITYNYTLLVSQLFGMGPEKLLTAKTVMFME